LLNIPLAGSPPCEARSPVTGMSMGEEVRVAWAANGSAAAGSTSLGFSPSTAAGSCGTFTGVVSAVSRFQVTFDTRSVLFAVVTVR
jgi:hypothetical protein